MRIVKEIANAKINLFLDVIRKREDGFHDIKTVMHSVKFGDEITVSVSKSDFPTVSLRLIGNKYLPTDSKNLAVKAANLFLERSGISEDVSITMIKRIPVAAGLAGGSSDAAAVLRALNRLHDRFFSNHALSTMASELGSDVAYCLYGKTALCEGRGEILTRLPVKLSQTFVIAIAGEHVSTPQAYKSLDAIYSDFSNKDTTESDKTLKALMLSLEKGDLNPEGFYNIFEEAVLPVCKGAEALKKKLTELGARVAMMSGSGPSVFGVFDDIETAKRACFSLRDQHYTAYYALSV